MADFIQVANVFVARDGTAAIVARTRNHGVVAEVADGTVRVEPSGDIATLGRAIRSALRGCEGGGPIDLRDTKKTDWPSFRASGCRSVAAFERAFVAYILMGANAANITYIATSQPLGPDVSLTSSRSSATSADELGSWIVELHGLFLRVEPIAKR